MQPTCLPLAFAWTGILAGILAGFTAVVPAQSSMLGFTHRGAGLATVDLGSCRAKFCAGTGIGPRVAARAGGTAWDGRQSAAWISNGIDLGVVQVLPGGAACRPVCVRQAPLPGTGVRFVTGLAMVEAGVQPRPGVPGPRGTLILAYSNQMLGRAEVRGCALAATPTYCDLSPVLGTGRQVGGLATDDGRGLLFIGTSSSVSTSPANVIYVTGIDRPCVPLCRLAVTVNQAVCPVRLGPITGLAYDACRQQLAITDGRTVIYGRLQVTLNPASCRFVHAGCCAATGNEELTGIAMRPQAPVPVGAACTAAGCSACPGMTAATLGDPVVGNGDFAFALQGAPANFSLAVLGIGFGGCSSSGVSLGFCAPVRVALGPVRPLLLTLGNGAPGPGCGGNLTLPVALPVQPGLCGLELSVQWVVGCPRGGSGVTPCLTVAIQ